MSWNYRVIRFVEGDEVTHCIHEVHYDFGKPRAFGVPPAAVSTSDSPTEFVEDLETILGLMSGALAKPVLTPADFPDGGVIQQSAIDPATLPAWEDPRVQTVYDLLVLDEAPPNLEEHWDGWIARRIVAALFPTEPK